MSPFAAHPKKPTSKWHFTCQLLTESPPASLPARLWVLAMAGVSDGKRWSAVRLRRVLGLPDGFASLFHCNTASCPHLTRSSTLRNFRPSFLLFTPR